MADIERTAKKALKTVGDVNPAKKGPLSGAKGLAAGAALIAAAPLATKLAGPRLSQLGDKVQERLDEATPDGLSDILPDMPDMPDMPNPFSGNGDGDGDEDESGGAAPGHGSGRRMPIQQSVDVAVPLTEVYNHWTQFEDWPLFMHRLESVEQVDDATVGFEAKFWGIRRRFEAEIVEQKPDERIEWDVSQGVAHTGVVTFHELAERLTRIEVTLDIEPSGLIEKAGRGWRFAKRGVRGDLHRFKAYAELADEKPKGWRGTIEDGDVKRRTERKPSARKPSARKTSNSSNGSSSSGTRKKAASKS